MHYIIYYYGFVIFLSCNYEKHRESNSISTFGRICHCGPAERGGLAWRGPSCGSGAGLHAVLFRRARFLFVLAEERRQGGKDRAGHRADPYVRYRPERTLRKQAAKKANLNPDAVVAAFANSHEILGLVSQSYNNINAPKVIAAHCRGRRRRGRSQELDPITNMSMDRRSHTRRRENQGYRQAVASRHPGY